MKRFACLAALAAAASVFAATDTAEACGGCFVPPSENTVVTGHRMALSISMEQTVLWDQIQYTGDPQDFSWVLPVKPGARLEVGQDAWFEVLEAATSVSVREPQVNCSPEWGGEGYDGDYYEGGGNGFGCGSSDEMEMDAPAAYGSSSGTGGLTPPPPDVEVVSKGSAGPYEVVTLSTDIPGALNDWLTEHGYNVPDEMQPIIDDYVTDGFDFIALRLQPNIGVTQMQPVRVVTQGAGFALPLRMVAAGTGASTALTLFLLSEGRYEAENFDNILSPADQVAWDFADSSSNYAELRVDALKANEGRTWMTSYAQPESLLNPVWDEAAMANVRYGVGNTTAETIASAYVQQALANDVDGNTGCLNMLSNIATSSQLVVDTCDVDGVCDTGNNIEARDLKCGDADDVGVALTGMHPRDVWITRLEADLPRSALSTDLLLTAADSQSHVDNRIVAPKYVNHPYCENESAGFVISGGNSRKKRPTVPGGMITLFFGAAAMAWFYRRRRSALS
jgi:hypothetical protein